jgi:hypothetical protein
MTAQSRSFHARDAALDMVGSGISIPASGCSAFFTETFDSPNQRRYCSAPRRLPAESFIRRLPLFNLRCLSKGEDDVNAAGLTFGRDATA